jgi:hypothetical protein
LDSFKLAPFATHGKPLLDALGWSPDECDWFAAGSLLIFPVSGETDRVPRPTKLIDRLSAFQRLLVGW